MEVSITTTVIIALAFFCAGVIDSVSGGGGLITLPTFMLTGFPVHLISGTNQCSCLLGTFTSVGRYLKSGKVHLFTAIASGVFAVPGSILGAWLNLILPAKYLQIIMIVILPVMGAVILLKRNFGTENRVDSLKKWQQVLVGALIGFLFGGYTGFYGAGSGTLMLLGFTLLGRLDMVSGSANARFCALFASLAATITYAVSGAIVWQVVAPAAILNIIGNYIGAGLAIRKGAKVIRPMFIIVFILLIARVVYSLVTG